MLSCSGIIPLPARDMHSGVWLLNWQTVHLQTALNITGELASCVLISRTTQLDSHVAVSPTTAWGNISAMLQQVFPVGGTIPPCYNRCI